MSRVGLVVSGCILGAVALYAVALTAADDSVSKASPWADAAAAGIVALLVGGAAVVVLGRRRKR